MLLIQRSPFVEAGEFAKRVQVEAGTSLTEQVRYAWRLAFARSPSDQELKESLTYLRTQTGFFTKNPVTVADPKSKKKLPRPAEEVALASFCQLLLGANEFLYVD